MSQGSSTSKPANMNYKIYDTNPSEPLNKKNQLSKDTIKSSVITKEVLKDHRNQPNNNYDLNKSQISGGFEKDKSLPIYFPHENSLHMAKQKNNSFIMSRLEDFYPTPFHIFTKKAKDASDAETTSSSFLNFKNLNFSLEQNSSPQKLISDCEKYFKGEFKPNPAEMFSYFTENFKEKNGTEDYLNFKLKDSFGTKISDNSKFSYFKCFDNQESNNSESTNDLWGSQDYYQVLQSNNTKYEELCKETSIENLYGCRINKVVCSSSESRQESNLFRPY